MSNLVNTMNYYHPRITFVLTGSTIRFGFDFLAHLGKIGEELTYRRKEVEIDKDGALHLKRRRHIFFFFFFFFFDLLTSSFPSLVSLPLPFLCRNSAYSVVELISWRMRGRRVTMPDPRGRKSRPTKFSSTLLFPAD